MLENPPDAGPSSTRRPGTGKARVLGGCHAATAPVCQGAPTAGGFVAGFGERRMSWPSACRSLGEAASHALRLKATADQVLSVDGTSVPPRSRQSGGSSGSTRNALWRPSGQTVRTSHRSRARITSECGARSARGPQDRRGRPAGTAVWPSSRYWGLGAFVGMSSAGWRRQPRPSRRRRSRGCDQTDATATVGPGRAIPVVAK